MPPSPRKRSQLALQLPEDLIRRLRDLARVRGCTVSHLAMTAFTEALGEGRKDADLAGRVTDLEARVSALEAASPPLVEPHPPAPGPTAAPAPAPAAAALVRPDAPLELPPIGTLLTSSAIARATGTNPSGWSAWAANHPTGSIRQYGGGSFRLVVRSDRGRRRISWERLA